MATQDVKHKMADVKRLTREHILSARLDGLDNIREAVARKLGYTDRQWPDLLDQQVYRVLRMMVSEGELVQEGHGGRYNAIRYYTSERHQEELASREAARQARAELQAAWETIRDDLRARGLDARLSDPAARGGRIDLDLDGWQELLSRLS